MRILLVILMLGIWGVYAQQKIELTNNGDTLTIQEGAILYIEGGIWNKTTGQIFNDGVIYTSDTVQNDAANGMFIDNYPTGTAIIGTVILNGAQQYIRGNAPIRFDSLLLRGTDKKILQQNAYVEVLLDLENKELATTTFQMIVTNPSPGAIIRQNGFVSSDLGGYLVRYTNSTNSYLFPVGASAPVFRYRPVEIIPQQATANQYAVRFANVDPTTEGWDRNQKASDVCLVNPDYYHQVKQVAGTSSATIRFTYDPTDPVKDGLAQWTTLWENRTSVANHLTATNQWELPNWNNFNTENFAFISQSVLALFDLTDSVYCLDPIAVPLTGATPAGGTFYVNGQPLPSDTIYLNNIGAGQHLIQYIYSSGGCSDTAEQYLIVKDYPQAQLTPAQDTFLCPGQTLTLSLSGVQPSWVIAWSTGDQTPSITVTQTGTYSVWIIDTTYAEACSTQLGPIQVLEGDSIYPTLSVDDSLLCEGDAALFTVQPQDSQWTYYWYKDGQLLQQGSVFQLQGNQAGTYYVAVQGPCYLETTAPISLILLSPPVADFVYTPDSINIADIVQFVFSGSANPQDPIRDYLWDFPQGVQLQGAQVQYQFNEAGTYPVLLTVISENGCQDTVLKYIEVINPFGLWIPNVFTPNADGLNDYFFPVFRGVQNITIQIYDRWGNLIWEGSGIDKWDGRTSWNSPCPEGVYVYVITAEQLNGKKIQRVGTVTLIR